MIHAFCQHRSHIAVCILYIPRAENNIKIWFESFFGSEIDLAEWYTDVWWRPWYDYSEGRLTIPLYKPEISANKQLVLCPAGLHLITVAALFHAVFVHSLRTLKMVVWRPVIRCSGTVATAEIQSDVICAPSLIAHAMCRMANLPQKSEETASFLPVDTFQNQSMYGISLSDCIFYSLSGTNTSVYCFDRGCEFYLTNCATLHSWSKHDCFANIHAKGQGKAARKSTARYG